MLTLRMSSRAFFPTLALLAFASLSAQAEPVIKADGKPGVATSWTANKSAVVLEIGAAYDAADVAGAIEKNVEGATAKAKGSTVIVSGVAEKVLLEALAKIDVEPASDDIDELLTELQSPGGEDEGSGSSIRATQAADFSSVLGKEVVTGKVIKVKRHRFPVVMVTMKVTKVAKGVKGVRRGQRITFLPRVKSRDGVIDPSDQVSKLNVGAWYAVKGDRVRVRLEPPKRGPKGVRVAAAFERLK